MNSFLINRKRLFEQMEDESFLLLHSNNAPHKTTDQYYPFRVKKNFYYLTGIKESNCTLLMLKSNKTSKTYLFIDETTEFMKLWVGEKISKDDASKVRNVMLSI